MEPDEVRKTMLIRTLRAEIARTTGRRYDIALEMLDEQSLIQLRRLLRDLYSDKTAAVRRARRFLPHR